MSPEQVEKFLKKIKRLQDLMISVATSEERIQDVEDEYNELYQDVELDIELYQDAGIFLQNPNNFSSLWKWYEFYSHNLENKWAVRRSYVNELYEGIVPSINKALYKLKNHQSSQIDFIQDLQHRFQITSSNPKAALFVESENSASKISGQSRGTVPSSQPVLSQSASIISTSSRNQQSEKTLTHRLERLNDTLDALQQEWKQRNAKRKQFRAALAIEANTANKFQLEQQVQAEETQLNELEHTIKQIETDIEQVTQAMALRCGEVNEAIAPDTEKAPERELEAQDLSPAVSGDADVVARDKIDLRKSQGAIVHPAAGAVIKQQFGNTTNINTGGGDYAGGSLSK